MKVVSQFGIFTGEDEDIHAHSHNKDKRRSSLQMNSLLGSRVLTRTATTTSSNQKSNDDIPVPANAREEDEQLQRALAASLGRDPPALSDNNDFAPVVAPSQNPAPTQAAAVGYFC